MEGDRCLGRRGWLAATGAAAIPIMVGLAVMPPTFRGLLVDEYAYLLPALSMAKGGGLRASATAIAPNLTPMLAGGASAWLFGPSHASVRAVSAVALLATALACAGMACRLGAGRRWAVLVALVIASGPVTLPLGMIFMSDIPFAAMVAWSGYFAIKWFDNRSPRSALAVGMLCALATMSRPQGVLVAAGCVLLSWISRRTQRARAAELVAFGAPILLGMAALAAWLVSDATSNRSMSHYTLAAFTPTLTSVTKMFVFLPAFALLYMAFLTLGPSLATASRSAFNRLAATENRRRVLGVTALGPAIALALAVAGRKMPYMSWGSTLSSNGIGGGYRQEYPVGLWIAITAIVAVVSAGTGLALASANHSGVDQGSRLLLVIAALELIGAAPLGLAFSDSRVGFDRYLIPLLIFIAPLVALGASRLGARFWVATSVTVLVGIMTIVGMQDWIAQRRVSWEAAEALVAGGTPVERLDAGFEWNAAHLGESPPRDQPSPGADWQVTEFAPAIDPEWVLARDPRPGYTVVREIPWRSWSRHGELLLLHREG